MFVLQVYPHPLQSLVGLHGCRSTMTVEHTVQRLRQALYVGMVMEVFVTAWSFLAVLFFLGSAAF